MLPQWITQLAEIARDLGIAAGAILAGIAAVVAVRTWRGELKGQTQYDLARKIYVQARQFAYDVERAQRAAISENELALREGALPDYLPHAVDSEHYARLFRAKRLLPGLRTLNDLLWEARFVLDLNDVALFKPFDVAWNDLNASINLYFANKSAGSQSGQGMLDPETGRAHVKNVYGTKDNAVARELEIGLNDLRRQLKKFIH